MPDTRSPAHGVDVLTYHNDDSRTGANLNENKLTTQNVNASSFGKLFRYTVDGYVYAQPLAVGGVRMGDGRVHNVLFVATENDSVYALDANRPDRGPAARRRALANQLHRPGERHHARPIPGRRGPRHPADARHHRHARHRPGHEHALRRQQGEGAAARRGRAALRRRSSTPWTSATERRSSGSPVTIGDTTLNPDGSFTNNTPVSVPGTGAGSADGVVAFNALRENNRPGLVFDTNVPGHPDGVVFAGFGSQGDFDSYHGWIVGFDAKTSKIVTLFNTDPNGDFGAVWQAGAAPSVASNGDLIFSTGNGTFDAFTTTTPPGPAAQGEAGFGLGYAGIGNSVGVTFGAAIPGTGVSSTGLFHDGVFPTDKPLAADVFQPLRGTGIDFTAGAQDPNGPHTYRATLSYQRHHALRDDHRPDHRRHLQPHLLERGPPHQRRRRHRLRRLRRQHRRPARDDGHHELDLLQRRPDPHRPLGRLRQQRRPDGHRGHDVQRLRGRPDHRGGRAVWQPLRQWPA